MTSRSVEPVPRGATARRPDWLSLPLTVRDAVVDRLGSPVRHARTQTGGFTSGAAVRLRLADGSRAFVKAVSATAGAPIAAAYRQEAAVVPALPPDVPATRLRWSAEVPAGDETWVVLCFEDVEARHPARPWTLPDLARVLDVLPDAARALTPPPPGLPDLPTVASLDPQFRFWRRLAAGEVPAPSGSPRPDVRQLSALEADWADAAAGNTATHFDLRDDNILLTADGRVLLCDWNWLTVGAPWLDLVALLIEVHGDGLDADAALAGHPLGRDAPADAVDAFLAALGGYFTERADAEPVPSSPWLRRHQAWCRDVTLDWLAHRRNSR
jgi:hypothetical protein